MFTDIAGCTAYAATRGDRAAARLVHQDDAAVLPEIRRYSGRIPKPLGDGLEIDATPGQCYKTALSWYCFRVLFRRPAPGTEIEGPSHDSNEEAY